MSEFDEFEVTIHGTPQAAKTIHKRIVSLVEKYQFSMRELFSVRLALQEALTNAIKHGNRMDPNKCLQIRCRIDGNGMRIVIEDEGQGFQQDEVPDPTAEENLMKPSGRGIKIMRSFMSLVEYNDIGNRLVLEKQRGIAD